MHTATVAETNFVLGWMRIRVDTGRVHRQIQYVSWVATVKKNVPISVARGLPVGGGCCVGLLRLNAAGAEGSGSRCGCGGTRITGDGLSALSGMQNLVTLELTGTQLEDADVSHLIALPNVQRLQIGRTGISDSALAGLSQMPTLRAVGIDSTQATPEGIAGLADCPRLDTVMLVDANDESVAQVSQLIGLFALILVGEDVTAASLPALKQMQGLRHLRLYDSDLSDAEILDLQQSLPGCTVQQLPREVVEQIEESQWE